MKTRFPSADEYMAQEARCPDSTLVDIQACQQTVTEPYRNDVLSNVNGECLRLAVFEGEYRWHSHPDSDELFLVAAGKLQIDLAGHDSVELTEWQYLVVPAGTIHRTRAIGRTVNVTIEKQHARTVFTEAGDV
jgi:mannose-6-phosphate isomerase-like protein (cupin superfamily)